ncbi:MAG: phycobilisome linker polypeptide [Cyanobacteriota bacterium]|jgi:phycocyanin-associated rod protein|nr:phycobilisome linker polypeptide [Cyanobacteriota bacterium]
MKVSAGTRNTSSSNDRQVTINVTGLARNDFVRSADCVMQVPYTRMNETLRLVHRMGGKVTGVSVSGISPAGEVSPAPARTGKSSG